MRMRETWSLTQETRPFQWTRCCTSAKRCRRQCRPTWLWVECRGCWAGTSCQLNGSCTSHRSVTRCSWSCTARYDPLGKFSRPCWSSCVPDENSNFTLHSTDTGKTKQEQRVTRRLRSCFWKKMKDKTRDWIETAFPLRWQRASLVQIKWNQITFITFWQPLGWISNMLTLDTQSYKIQNVKYADKG